ncbi:PLP-dependent aminotransferase family protein [Ureibacillus aquaedulcis]|uniref:PLP-dependent aminotransferase family protein n=1 Tax=Ureibacillus aquaedulcis TaxID=3058421 RepID=A0ABT8GTV7_9BACL|nr:PLP-dependent aminotransferase family protein [Ureibacillus sp. BA0131]MDN4494827.1 PLP-dependent aminotransferase family protein [Ureibacillus sp. BA0131]
MYKFSKRMGEVSSSAVREIFKAMADPEMISFGGGSPANESFPIDEVKGITDKVLTQNGHKILQYGITEGWAPLKEAYLKHIAHPKGIKGSSENVIVTTGASQGIHLLADAFLEPGDVVLVESPTFLGVFSTFNKYFVKSIPVAMDEHGLIMEDLEAKIKEHNPKMIYTIPTFQNPTGRTLPLERRQKIAELASQHNVIVLEDDPYCDLRYSGEALPNIKTFDQTGHVVLLNSFAKIISPGLRVGTVLAEAEIIQKLTVAKQGADTHTANLTQAICAEFLEQGLLPDHLKKINAMYAEKLNTMVTSIERYFPEGTKFTKPEGGLFIWVELPGEPDVLALFERATSEYKVAFVPGIHFCKNPDDGSRHLRLNFSSSTPEKIEEGIKKLGELFIQDLEEK